MDKNSLHPETGRATTAAAGGRPEYLTLADVRRITGLSRSTVLRLVDRNNPLLPHYRPSPRKILVRAADLEEYMRSRRIGG